MRKSRHDRELKVEVSYVPCDPQEWEDALDVLAGIFVDAYRSDRSKKYRELNRSQQAYQDRVKQEQ